MKRIAIPVAAITLLAAVYWFFIRDKDDEKNKEEVAEKVDKPNKKPAKRTDRARGDRSNRTGGGEVAVLFDDDPEGNLQLEGRVVDDAEVGVAGAIVAINSNPPRTVRTEGDGSFAIGKLVGREYRIVARHTTGTAGPVITKLTETSDPVTMPLKAGGVVNVNVLDKSSKPIGDATVELRGIDRISQSTDSKGAASFIHVIPDGYEVVARASGYAPQRQWIRVRPGSAAIDVRLALRTGASVKGRVISHDGKPVEGAQVIYGGASEWSQRANPRFDAAETDAKGNFEFAALPAGSFRFTARASGRAPGSSELVTLDGTTAVDGIELRMKEGAVISGRVLSSSGDPVPAARVRISEKNVGFRGRVRETYADDEGNYEIEGLERAELEVIARGPEASSETVAIDLTAAPFKRTIDITLDLDGAIAGVVVDSEGVELAGVQVWAFPDFRAGNRINFRLRGVSRVLTDAGGRFRLTGIKPGQYMVRASRTQTGRRGGWLIKPTIAKAGDEDVRIELPPDGGIVGKVAFKDGSAPAAFSIGLGGWGAGTPFATKDGSFELADLSPQTYTMTVRGPGFDSKQIEVEVKPGKPIDLGTITVKKGRVLIGTVLDPSGSPVAGATVSAGRQIFGNGSSSSAGGRFGPPMARNTKTATSDESGQFAIYGLPLGDVSIVAEHETKGRSIAQLIRTGESVTGMQIQLAPYGSLEGKVIKAGAPAGDVRVSVASLTSPDVLFGVATGEDGTFRFDRLAPDDYKVAGMIGRSPMRGFGLQAQKVSVESGKTAQVTLTLSPGDIALSVNLNETSGKTLNFSWVTAVRGEVTAATGRELELAIGRQPESYSAQVFSIAGAAATIPELGPGTWTVCATPYPVEVTGMSGTMAYMEREGDNLPTHCKTLPLAESPNAQETSIDVVAPEFVPPAPDES